MEAVPSNKVVFFDLDNTLFDHLHSLQAAISAVQQKFPAFSGYRLETLASRYNESLQQAFDLDLDDKITHEETDAVKIRFFFANLGFPEPKLDEIKEFCDTYKPAYQGNRRATPGSIETLSRLREHGYRLAIIINGRIGDQVAKAKAIGIFHFFDFIITSEEAGSPKPDIGIFQIAIKKLDAPLHMTYMIGDSVESDIKGALDAQLSAILYAPMSGKSRIPVSGKDIHVIRHMSQLLGHMGI